MTTPRKTLGDYLSAEDPLGPLWLDLVNIVFRDSPSDAHVERLGSAAAVVYDVVMFAGEITNGGISQFFGNSSGARAHETLAALRKVGAHVCVGLLERSLALFPGGIAPKDHVKRRGLLFAFETREPLLLKQLTQEYYKRVDALGAVPEEDLVALKLDFIRANANEPVETGQ